MKIITYPSSLLRRMYAWTVHWAKTKQAPYALFAVAFIESSVFPVPPDVLLIALTVAERKKWIRYATICTLGSVCGAFLGYFIGWALFETVGKFIVETYKLQHAITIVGQKYQENAFLTIFAAAFTPIPYKAITITAGLFQISLLTLTIASLIGRAGRFFLVGGILRVFGKKISDSIEKYFDIFSIVFVILLVGGFFVFKHTLK